MGDDNVEPLKLETVGEEYRFDPDQLLEAAKGQQFSKLAIVGELPDGEMWVSSNSNAGETMILMELVKHHILFGGPFG